MKPLTFAAVALFTAGFASLASASTGPAVCSQDIDRTGAVVLSECFGSNATEDRRGRGKDDGPGHKRRGRGADDGAGHTSVTVPAAPVEEAGRGRGKDDGPGHARRGRGKDDPVGHG